MGIRTVTGVAIAALVLGLGLPADAVPNDGAKAAPRADLPEIASDRAEQALDDVRAMFEGDPAAARGAATDHGRDATLALRDLIRVRHKLTGSSAREADRLLARPAPGQTECLPRICVHWRAGQVRQRDADNNQIPDYIDQVLLAVGEVHQRYVDAGYRAPKRDGNRGGDSRTDIYIRDVGAQGIYGYCTSDKRFSPDGPFDSWAYCVLDNDYRRGQFPNLNPLDNMRVTAAHEYFHAVQFAYDAFEDGWFMEATATWAEDEVYDDINDNLQYLRHGPLRRPRIPLDKFQNFGLHQYGDWIFFRYLTERFPDGVGMPALVRQMWERADGSAGARDMYSMQAVRATLAARGESFARNFTRFADANRRPGLTYDEGAENRYPGAPLSGSRVLGPRETTDWLTRQLDHQSSTTLRFVPDRLPAADWRLRVRFDLAHRIRGSQAVVTSYRVGQPPETSFISLNRTGAGVAAVPFSSDEVSRVEVTLVNASVRTRCWVRPTSPYSCFGTPRDDNLSERVRVAVVR